MFSPIKGLDSSVLFGKESKFELSEDGRLLRITRQFGPTEVMFNGEWLQQPISVVVETATGRKIDDNQFPSPVASIKTGKPRASSPWHVAAQPWYTWERGTPPSTSYGDAVTASGPGQFIACVGWPSPDVLVRSEKSISDVFLWKGSTEEKVFLRLPGMGFCLASGSGKMLAILRFASGREKNRPEIEIWNPEEVRDQLPEILIRCMDAPNGAVAADSELLPPLLHVDFMEISWICLLLVITLGLFELSNTHRTRKGQQSFSPRYWWTLALWGLMLLSLGFFFLLTFLQTPGWTWKDLLANSIWIYFLFAVGLWTVIEGYLAYQTGNRNRMEQEEYSPEAGRMIIQPPLLAHKSTGWSKLRRFFLIQLAILALLPFVMKAFLALGRAYQGRTLQWIVGIQIMAAAALLAWWTRAKKKVGLRHGIAPSQWFDQVDRVKK